MAALAGDGSLPQPQLAIGTMDNEGAWQARALKTETTVATSSDTAQAIRQALPQHDGIREFSPLVISGPEGSTNAWYVGLAASDTADYVVIVVLEGSDEETTALEMGRGVLSAAQ